MSKNLLYYKDPDIVKLIKQRIIPSLKTHKDKWSLEIDLPMQQFYVIHGQHKCGSFHVLTTILDEKKISWSYYTFKTKAIKHLEMQPLDMMKHFCKWIESTPKSKASVLIIKNIHPFLAHFDVLFRPVIKDPQPQIVVVLNNSPRERNEYYWTTFFDYEITMQTPPKDIVKLMFKDCLELMIGQTQTTLSLTDKDYEYLSLCANGCIAADIIKFCQKVIYDAIYNQVTTPITLEYLKKEKYLIDNLNIETTYPAITYRKTHREQELYETPPTKKIKFK